MSESGVLSAFDMSGRVAVVTGGASGIGRSTAEVLGGVGASVVVGDLNEDGADETVSRIVDAGGKAVAHRTDVTRRSDVDALVDRAVEEFGRLDAMCNVAGIAHEGPVADITEEQFDRLFAINTKGVLWGCQAAMRVMTPQGSGAIVNVSSTSIDTPAPGYGLYAMTKAAVAQLTMSLAWEAGRHGIRVNTIAPGMTVTPFTARHAYREDGTVDESKLEEFVDRMKRLSPLGLVGEAIDQALLTLFLVSDAGRFCHAQVWRANGGQAVVR